MSNANAFRGVYLSEMLMRDEALSALDMCVMSEIILLDGGDGCYASNRHFAKHYHCNDKTITRTLKHLADLGYISVKVLPGNKRRIRCLLMVVKGKEVEYADERVETVWDGEYMPPFGQNAVTKCPDPSFDFVPTSFENRTTLVRKCPDLVRFCPTEIKTKEELKDKEKTTTTPSPLLQGDVAVDDTADAVGSDGVLLGWDAFITAYQQNVEALPRPLKLQGLLEDFRTLGPEVMQEAIKRTVDANPTNAAPYFDAVVREWIKAGVDTPEKARLTTEQRTRKGVSPRAAAQTVDEEWEKEKRRRYNDLSPERLYG